MTAAIILAAGRGERMGADVDKAFLSLGPKPLVAYSLAAFEACSDIDAVFLVVRRDRIDGAREMCRIFGMSKLSGVIPGGSRRQDSVRAVLAALPPDAAIGSIHDSARPLVTPALISATVKSARETGSGVAASKVVDTLKLVERGNIAASTVDRAKLWAVATPQTFRTALIRRAYDAVADSKKTVTDDAGALELIGEKARLVEWRNPNIKVTVAEDLAVAGALLRI